LIVIFGTSQFYTDYQSLTFSTIPLFSNYLGNAAKNKCFTQKTNSASALGWVTYGTMSNDNGQENINVDPNWVTGLYNKKGGFQIKVSERIADSGRWQVALCFYISVHKDQIKILELLKIYFGAGNIRISGEMAIFQITKINDIVYKVISHFDRYPLVGSRQSIYLLWREAAHLILAKKHLNLTANSRVLEIYAALSVNVISNVKGDKVFKAFPNVVKATLPKPINPISLNPLWVLGYCEFGSSFQIILPPRDLAAYFRFSCSGKDFELLSLLHKFFEGGKVIRRFNSDRVDYTISTKDALTNMTYLFETHPFLSINKSAFELFNQALELWERDFSRPIVIDKNIRPSYHNKSTYAKITKLADQLASIYDNK
jgi:hypothetical protein